VQQHSILVVTLFLSSAAAEARGEPAKVDEYIGLHCQDVVPPWVREKHLENAPFDEVLDASRCDCRFARKPFSLVTVACGATMESQRHEAPRGKTTPIAGLEDGAQKEMFGGDLVVSFTDRDTPCLVVIHADPKDPTSEAKAIALGRDIAKALTPDVVAKRRTVEALLWAQDRTGSKAAAALKAWPKEAEAMKELATLAPDLPKVVDHAGKEGWPEGKKSLLLGFCPNLEAARVVKYLRGALPGLTWHRVPAAETTLSCPVAKTKYDAEEVVQKQARVDPYSLSVIAFPARDPPNNPNRHVAIHAFLRDSKGALVTWHHEQVGIEGPLAKVPKLKPEANGMTIENAVRLEGYPQCKGDPRYTVTTQLTVEEGQIKSKTQEGGRPSCMCCAGE
jgi:hypothetical protein